MSILKESVNDFLNKEIDYHHFHHLGRGIALSVAVAFLFVANFTVSLAAEGSALDVSYWDTRHEVSAWVDDKKRNAYEQSVAVGYGIMGVEQEWKDFDWDDSVRILSG